MDDRPHRPAFFDPHSHLRLHKQLNNYSNTVRIVPTASPPSSMNENQMAVAERKSDRRNAVDELKRGLILDAARKVFEAEGLEGASLRAIASAAGYTPAALYFHFESKEAIYGEALRRSLANLEATVKRQASRAKPPSD